MSDSAFGCKLITIQILYVNTLTEYLADIFCIWPQIHMENI